MSAKLNLIVVFALVAALGALVTKEAEAGGLMMPFSVHRAEPHQVASHVLAKFITVDDCYPVDRDVCYACCKKFNLGSWTVYAAHSGKRHCECGN